MSFLKNKIDVEVLVRGDLSSDVTIHLYKLHPHCEPELINKIACERPKMGLQGRVQLSSYPHVVTITNLQFGDYLLQAVLPNGITSEIQHLEIAFNGLPLPNTLTFKIGL